MEKIREWGKRLWNWAIVSPWKKFRKWLNKSKFVAFILGATIVGTFGNCYVTIKYEYQDIFNNSRKIVIRNTSHALASNQVDENAGALQEKVEEFGVSAPMPDTPAIKIIKQISMQEGIDWKLVYAVCLKESGCRVPDCSKARGNCDGLQSMGPYQINKPSHPDITEEQANDLAWSTLWTIRHGMRFKDDPAVFFKNHNGLAKTTNQWYVDGAMEIYKTL